MGAMESVKMIAQSVLGDNELDDADEKLTEIEERLALLQENTKARLKSFYNEMLLEASGKEGTSVSVPICSVVDRVESTYVASSEELVNNLSNTIESVVESALGGDWKESITNLISGTLNTFLGPTKMRTSGMTQEKKTYNVVWAHNALIRLDTFVTKSQLNQMAGLNKSSQTFGGYIMVVSVVDIRKVQKEVFMYEFSQFVHEISKNGDKAVEKLNKQIQKSKELIQSIGGLYEEFENMGVGSSRSTKNKQELSQRKIVA